MQPNCPPPHHHPHALFRGTEASSNLNLEEERISESSGDPGSELLLFTDFYLFLPSFT